MELPARVEWVLVPHVLGAVVVLRPTVLLLVLLVLQTMVTTQSPKTVLLV